MKLFAQGILCGLWLAAACDSAPIPAAPAPPPFIGAPSISVGPNGQSLAVGDSLLFQATTNVPGTTAFAWSLSSVGVASITATGWVRALSPGPVAVVACVVPDRAICGNASLTIR